jgi:hypothetical protein
MIISGSVAIPGEDNYRLLRRIGNTVLVRLLCLLQLVLKLGVVQLESANELR